jgi:hydrogenase maturation factor
MAYAGNCSLFFDPNTVRIPEISARICQALNVDPLAAISSGALLISSAAEDSSRIIEELTEAAIESACIGSFEDGDPAVWLYKDNVRTLLPRPKRDEVARLLDERVD